MQTLFKRDIKTHKIQPGIFSKPEFENIREWQFTEKIDGMNIRVEYDNSDLCYRLQAVPGNQYARRKCFYTLKRSFRVLALKWYSKMRKM
jgi:hypothetical protein